MIYLLVLFAPQPQSAEMKLQKTIFVAALTMRSRCAASIILSMLVGTYLYVLSTY